MVKGTCYICDESAQENIIEHIRVMHPDLEIEKWPDGGIIVHEDPDESFPW